jgi:hypothetical protein
MEKPPAEAKTLLPAPKPSIRLVGTVKKIIPGLGNEAEKAEIAIAGADDLYREIRVANTFKDADGHVLRLEPLSNVTITIEAEIDPPH